MINPKSILAYLIIKNHPTIKDKLPIYQGQNTIGRVPQKSTIIIKDGQISSAHAKIKITSDKILLIDIGSKNGTFVNMDTKQRLDKGIPTQIHQGQTFTFGQVQCVVQRIPQNKKSSLTPQKSKQGQSNKPGVLFQLQQSSQAYLKNKNQKPNEQESNKSVNLFAAKYAKNEPKMVRIKKESIYLRTSQSELSQSESLQIPKKNQNNQQQHKNEKQTKNKLAKQKQEKQRLLKEKKVQQQKRKKEKEKLSKKQLQQLKKKQEEQKLKRQKERLQRNRITKEQERLEKQEMQRVQLQAKKKQESKKLKQKQKFKKKSQQLDKPQIDEPNNKKSKKSKPLSKQKEGKSLSKGKQQKKSSKQQSSLQKKKTQNQSKQKEKQGIKKANKQQTQEIIEEKKSSKDKKMMKKGGKKVLQIQRESSEQKNEQKRKSTSRETKKKDNKDGATKTRKRVPKNYKDQNSLEKSKVYRTRQRLLKVTKFMVSGEPITFKTSPILQPAKDIDEDYDVLVMDSYKRTFKLLFSIVRGKPIVDKSWLTDSEYAKKPMQFDKYWMTCPSNKNLIKQSVLKAQQGFRVLNDMKFFIACEDEKLHIPYENLERLIYAAGGEVLRSLKSVKSNKNLCKEIIILLDEKYNDEELSTAKEINKENVYLVELVLQACLTQELDMKTYKVKL